MKSTSSEIPEPDSKQDHTDFRSFVKNYGVSGIVVAIFFGLPTFIYNIYNLIHAAPIDPHNVVSAILIGFFASSSLLGCIPIAVYYLTPKHNRNLLYIGVLVVAISASILLGFFLQDQIFKRIEPCPPCLTPSPIETSPNTSIPTPTPSQIPTPPTETLLPPQPANLPSLTPSATSIPPIYAIIDCISDRSWAFTVASQGALRDPEKPDCLYLENWGLYAGARLQTDSPRGLHIFRTLSPGVTVGIRHNVNRSEKISLDIDLESISSFEDCTDRETCDINLVVGIGSPTEYDGAFVVFRALKQNSSVYVCLLDSIFSSCDSPVLSFPPGDPVPPYRLIFTFDGPQVLVQLGRAQPLRFTLGANQSTTLWIGYNARSNGEIDAYITFP